MHEIGIAESVLETVRTELSRHPGARGVEIGIKVGELSGVEPDALQFSFQALLSDTDLEPLRVNIETCPRRYRCRCCGLDYTVDGWDLACPGCGETNVERIGGDELEISYLDLEEA